LNCGPEEFEALRCYGLYKRFVIERNYRFYFLMGNDFFKLGNEFDRKNIRESITS